MAQITFSDLDSETWEIALKTPNPEKIYNLLVYINKIWPQAHVIFCQQDKTAPPILLSRLLLMKDKKSIFSASKLIHYICMEKPVGIKEFTKEVRDSLEHISLRVYRDRVIMVYNIYSMFMDEAIEDNYNNYSKIGPIKAIQKWFYHLGD